MPEDSATLGQRAAKGPSVKTLAIGLSAAAIAGWLFIAIINFGGIIMPKPLLGVLALAFLLAYSSVIALLIWKLGQRERIAFQYFKYLGYWLMAPAYGVVVWALTMIVMFDLVIPPPSFLPSTFVSALTWISLGAGLFAFFAFALWLLGIVLKARSDFRRWLNSSES